MLQEGLVAGEPWIRLTDVTVKDLDNLYDVNFYLLLSGVTSACKNVIMLQAKNLDKPYDFEGAFACCIQSEQSAAHHDWDARSHARQRETCIHCCTEVGVLARVWGDAEQEARIPAQPAKTPGLSGCGCLETRWQFNQGVTLELQSAAISIERGNYVRLLEHCHKNVKLYNNK